MVTRILCVLLAGCLAGCSLVVDSRLEEKRRDAGTGEDAGGDPDGGPPDGGPMPDGATPTDGGPTDGSVELDGGPTPDGGDLCSGSHACVPEAPTGWTGPLALFTGGADDDAPACAGAYPTSAGSFFGDLFPGEAACECECDPAAGITCTGQTRICYGSSSSFCITACFSSDSTAGPSPGTCTSVSTTGTLAQIVFPNPSNHGSCSARAAHTMGTPQWGTVAKACGGATTGPTGCGAGDTCAPIPSDTFGDLCVQQSGDVACPAGAYTEKHLFHESFTDTRACSSCSCGSATSRCGGSVNFLSNTACSVLSAPAVSGCGEHGGGTRATYSPSPTGTCPPSTSTLSGGVSTSGAVTFCCLP